MCLPMLKKTAKIIVIMLKDFLWGFNHLGGRKIPLVSWNKTCTPRAAGGLGIKCIHLLTGFVESMGSQGPSKA